MPEVRLCLLHPQEGTDVAIHGYIRLHKGYLHTETRSLGELLTIDEGLENYNHVGI